ncbi:type II secretion system F family protein [Clostridium butyricum]
MNKEKLRKADMYEVLEGKIVNKVRSLFSEKRNLVIRRGADEKQVSFIARSLGEMYKDGITINKALTLVRESVSHKEYKNSLKTIHSAIHNGKGLSEAFKECTPLYPELFIGLIFIGENTGKLYEILKRLGNFYEKICEIKNEVKMACIYPLFIII